MRACCYVASAVICLGDEQPVGSLVGCTVLGTRDGKVTLFINLSRPDRIKWSRSKCVTPYGQRLLMCARCPDPSGLSLVPYRHNAVPPEPLSQVSVEPQSVTQAWSLCAYLHSFRIHISSSYPDKNQRMRTTRPGNTARLKRYANLVRQSSHHSQCSIPITNLSSPQPPVPPSTMTAKM